MGGGGGSGGGGGGGEVEVVVVVVIIKLMTEDMVTPPHRLDVQGLKQGRVACG